MRWTAVALVLLLSGCGNGGSGAMDGYPDASSSEFAVFSHHCSQCHAPPHPDAHTAAEWPMVVARMRQHMVQRGLGSVSAQEQESMLRYLETHAKVEQ